MYDLNKSFPQLSSDMLIIFLSEERQRQFKLAHGPLHIYSKEQIGQLWDEFEDKFNRMAVELDIVGYIQKLDSNGVPVKGKVWC